MLEMRLKTSHVITPGISTEFRSGRRAEARILLCVHDQIANVVYSNCKNYGHLVGTTATGIRTAHH